MKGIFRAVLGMVLTYLIVVRFGWTGLLIALPFFFAVPFFLYWLKEKWRRRDSLR